MIAKTWFITGTSSGFGRAFAEYAIAKGYNVIATARDAAKLTDLVAKAPERVAAISLDVTRGGDAEAAMAAAEARFGGIDVLINNAGYAVMGAMEETVDAELRAIMDTNFFGAIAVTRAALPLFRRQRFGAIVNISSMGGQMSFAGFGAYSATKFALEGASEALALEMAPFGVKVMVVEPGAFRTALVGAAMRQMPDLGVYDDSVGATRAFSRDMNGSQEGDPAKAAAAIDQALLADKTPLRLVLGSDAVDALRHHAETVLQEIAQWERVSRATALD